MFKLDGEKYNNEQEIIDAGVIVIHYYCCYVRGRWRDIEHLMVESWWYGYWYAKDVIKGRYEPELEALYLVRCNGRSCIKWYIDNLVRYGNA